MFRLMFGRGVDTLTLARNARTSPEMIDRFYAAPLQGEMNVGELQSKRRPRPWEYRIEVGDDYVAQAGTGKCRVSGCSIAPFGFHLAMRCAGSQVGQCSQQSGIVDG